MSSWNIVCPNARRQQIKIQPNTKVLEVLEEAAKRQGLDPNEYNLVYQKRVLDISLTTRLTGIASNATLDLRKSDTLRKYQDVIIVLQLIDGTKLAPKSFRPDITTFEMILQSYKTESETLRAALESDNSDTHLTCVFLNEQICGLYQLKNTTLKDMGLLNGRVLIRVDMVRVENEQFKRKNDEFEQKLQKKLKLESIYQAKRLEEEAEQLKAAQIEANRMQTSVDREPSPEKIEKEETRLGPVKSSQIIDIIERPAPKEFANFKFDSKQETTSKSASRPDIKAAAVKEPNSEFAEFKFPEETKGQVLNNFNEFYEMEKTSKECCDRQAIFVDMTANQNINNKDSEEMEIEESETQGDIFDVTLQDLKKMLGELKKTQNDENMLMTKKMRELEEDKKVMRYPYIAIRICFKNRSFIQGIFRPKESINALYEFVKTSLRHETNTEEDSDFYLYTSPPKQVIKHDLKKSLFEYQLYPAAQVYFTNKSDRIPEYGQNIRKVSISEAKEIVATNIHQKIRDVDYEGMDWLVKEENAKGKALKASGLSGVANNILGQTRPRMTGTSQNSSTNENTKKKLGLFLGKK